MQIPTAVESTSEERVLAAISHGSAFMMGWGIIVPLAVWITQREKSEFSKFHALQAMVFQLTQTLFMMSLGLVFMFVLILLPFIFEATFDDVGEGQLFFLIFQLILIGGSFLMFAVYPAIGVLAAGLTLAKRNFRYPILGPWLQNYLTDSSKNPGENLHG